MAPTAEEFRELFMLDPAVSFLNHGSFGAVPRPVFEFQETLRRELESEPVLFLARRLPGRLAKVRSSIARYVNAESGDAIGLVPNATTGLNAVARSVALRRGDEILLTDHEYGAKKIMWDEVAARAGARVVAASLPRPARTEDGLVDAIAARFTRRTRVLFVSHITSLSALQLPVARLCALARERGVVSVIDGAHAPGQIELDVRAVGGDVYAGNLHKWVCAPRGSAFLWATPEARTWIRGPVISWDWSWSGDDAFQGRFADDIPRPTARAMTASIARLARAGTTFLSVPPGWLVVSTLRFRQLATTVTLLPALGGPGSRRTLALQAPRPVVLAGPQPGQAARTLAFAAASVGKTRMARDIVAAALDPGVE